MKRLLAIALFFALVGCVQIVPPPPGAPAAFNLTPTIRADQTVTPESVTIPTITILPGLTPLEHPGFPGIVFLVDLLRWTNDTRSEPSPAIQEEFLHYTTNPDCRLNAFIGSDLPVPESISLMVMRGRIFHIYEYDDSAIYESGNVFFKLEHTGSLQCRTTLETLLANIAADSVFHGQSVPTQFSTSTPAPRGGFSCNALAPQLQPGDTAYIGSSGVWLRETPSRSTGIPIQLFPRFSPVLIEILDGPRCADDHVYWHVSVVPIGGAGSLMGWMAETNTTRILLFNWDP
jgi:hypothetical protein